MSRLGKQWGSAEPCECGDTEALGGCRVVARQLFVVYC